MVDQNDQTGGEQIVPPQDQQDNGTVPQNAINRVQVKVPPFWKQNPSLWFKQLEAQFANSQIVNDLTKFNTIVGIIESDILSSVSDIVLNPPANNLYDTIKKRLIQQFSDSDNKKLKNLLNNFNTGDMKPTDLLRKMRELSCGKVGDDLLKTLWLQKLPTTIQAVLSTRTENLDQLMILADAMFDVTEQTSIQAINPVSNINFDDLVNVVYELEDKIDSLSKANRKSRRSSHTTSRNRSSTQASAFSSNKQDLCYFHKKFGKQARNCKKPCSFKNQKNE